MEYFLIIFASILASGQFGMSKYFQSKNAPTIKNNFLFATGTGLTAVVITGIIVLITGFEFSMFSFLFALLGAVFCVGNTYILVQGYKYGSMGTILFFMMLGFLLPFSYGVIFLHEEITIYKVLGIILLLSAMFIMTFFNEKKNKPKPIYYLLCLLIFISNGSLSIISKIHQISPEAISTYSFSFIMNVISSLMALFILLIIIFFERKKLPNVEETKTSKKQQLIIFTLFSIFCQFSYLLQLFAAVKGEASVIYPFFTGLNLIINIIVARIFFKEKIKLSIIFACITLLIGVVLFIF
jgi:drug/metabolite transporter (DMT)-like permease